MQITIIHGGDVKSAVVKLEQIVSKYQPIAVVRMSGEEITDEFLLNNLSGGDLFVSQKLVVLENPEQELDLGRYRVGEEVEVVLYFSKTLAAANFYLKSDLAKTAKIFVFEQRMERSIFTFLDLLAEKNDKALGMLEKLYGEFGDQYLLTMLYYLFRRQVVSDAKLPVGVRAKIERQRGNFSTERLRDLYEMALETDHKIKTGLIDGKSGVYDVVEEILR